MMGMESQLKMKIIIMYRIDWYRIDAFIISFTFSSNCLIERRGHYDDERALWWREGIMNKRTLSIWNPSMYHNLSYHLISLTSKRTLYYSALPKSYGLLYIMEYYKYYILLICTAWRFINVYNISLFNSISLWSLIIIYIIYIYICIAS